MVHSQWQHHINVWQRSKPSKQPYCRDNGLSYSRFLYWSNKQVKPLPESGISDSKLLPVTMTGNAPLWIAWVCWNFPMV